MPPHRSARSSTGDSSLPADDLPELRWDVWTTAHAKRSRVASAMQARFPNVGAHVIEDLFDDVCEAAASPIGEPNAWPGDASLEGFLRWRLERRILNHLERRATRHENLDDLTPVLATDEADPATIVAARDQTSIYARHLAELPDDAKRYIADLEAGLKRAEIVEKTGWGTKKLKLVRKRIQEAVLDARAAAAAALFPWPLTRSFRCTAGEPASASVCESSASSGGWLASGSFAKAVAVSAAVASLGVAATHVRFTSKVPAPVSPASTTSPVSRPSQGPTQAHDAAVLRSLVQQARRKATSSSRISHRRPPRVKTRVENLARRTRSGSRSTPSQPQVSAAAPNAQLGVDRSTAVTPEKSPASTSGGRPVVTDPPAQHSTASPTEFDLP